MSGYLYFNETGCPEIDAILAALTHAGGMYHQTVDWLEVDEEGFSQRDRIQMAAGEAAQKQNERRLAVETEHKALRHRLMNAEDALAEALKGNRRLESKLFEERRRAAGG